MDTPADAVHSRSAALRWPVACWLAVLLLIGVVQLVRAQWFDAAVFFGAALVAVASRWVPPRQARRAPRSALVLGAAIAAAAAGVLPRHSGALGAVVVAVGVAALAVAWPAPSAGPRRWPSGLRRLAWAWGTLVVAGCLWELVQFIAGRLHPNAPSYALSDLIDPLLDAAPGRIVFAVAWLACGVYLLRRGGAR